MPHEAVSPQLRCCGHDLAPGAIGAQVTVYDFDLDPGGKHARLISGLADLGTGIGRSVHPG